MGYWREKPLDQRFRDTYEFIKTQMVGVPGVEAGIALMDIQTRVLNAAGDLVRLLEVMSLGFRWELIKSADETRRRHYIRAVLFGYATLGDPDNDGEILTVNQVKTKKDTITGLSEAGLRQLLTRMFAQSVVTEGDRTFVGFDMSLEKENAVWALDKIAEAITRVERALFAVVRDPTEATRFRTWFGTSNRTLIRGNYGKILAGIQSGIMLIKDMDPSKNKVFGYVYPNGPNDPPRVYLCAAFWRAGKITWNPMDGLKILKDGRDSSDNPLGVILHELTHLFIGTEDHKYGQTKCKQLAISAPDLAAMNADNYEYYAESVVAG
ncbi:MAG: M35 family metallopeptidase [Bryobacteraceae bacterium]